MSDELTMPLDPEAVDAAIEQLEDDLAQLDNELAADNAAAADAADDGEEGYRQPTEEERAADRERLKRETERERMKDAARGGPPPPPRRPNVAEAVDLTALLAEQLARAHEVDEARKTLPCGPALAEGKEDEAVDACQAVEGFQTCKWVHSSSACPRTRAEERYVTIVRNFSAPPVDVRVPENETKIIMAAARLSDRVPLWKLDALQVVRSVLERKRVALALTNGAEVRTNKLDPEHPERIAKKVYLVGTEVLIVLGGNQGRGKTLAACYAIARNGGIYTRSPQWTRRGEIDVRSAIQAPVLVIDQFGREYFGDSRWALSQLEDVIDARSQSSSKLTFLVGNIRYETFRERLKDTTIADRVDLGVFVELGGDSVRVDLRAAALAGGKT